MELNNAIKEIAHTAVCSNMVLHARATSTSKVLDDFDRDAVVSFDECFAVTASRRWTDLFLGLLDVGGSFGDDVEDLVADGGAGVGARSGDLGVGTVLV